MEGTEIMASGASGESGFPRLSMPLHLTFTGIIGGTLLLGHMIFL